MSRIDDREGRKLFVPSTPLRSNKNMNIIKVRDACKEYRSKLESIKVLRHFSMNVEPGTM